MGDHRAHIKIEFSMYGLTQKWDASINWCRDNGPVDGVDGRVTDWFHEAHAKMRGHWDSQQVDHAEARLRDSELAELRRLQEKYPDGK